MAGITDIIGNIKGFFQKRMQPQPMESGDDPEYSRIFNFYWEKGYDAEQIDDIMDGKVDPSEIVPSRQKIDSEGNLYVDQEPFRGANGGIASIRDFTGGGGVSGPGTGVSDSIPAMLSDGEFVMTADAVKGFGGGSRKQGAQKLYAMMEKAENSARNKRRS